MLEKFKLSTSQIILLALFVLILVITIFGYLEFNNMNSKLERIAYDLSKMKSIPDNYIHPENNIIESEQEPLGYEQKDNKEFLENPEYQEYQNNNEKIPEENQNNENLKKDLFNLTESKQEFAENIPEEQSAFSLGTIFGNEMPTGQGQSSGGNETTNNSEKDSDNIDKIDEDSEYSEDSEDSEDSENNEDSEDGEDKYSETEESKDNKITKEQLESINLKEIKKMCEDLNISKYGNKAVLIAKILKSQ